MFSKLLLKPLSIINIPRSKIPTSLFQKSSLYFSTHKQQRQQTKEREEELIKQISNLDTVAQQEQFTEKELHGIIQEREEQLKTVLVEKNIPIEAMLLGLTVSLPLLGGSSYLFYQLTQGVPTESFIPLLNTLTKAIGIHQCFQSGVHWGFAVSSHDLQTDSINSTPLARKQFILACLPAIAALANTMSLVYGLPADGLINYGPIAIMAGTQLFILVLDLKAVKDKSAPLWYGKLKYIIALICLASYGVYAGMYMNFGDKIKQLKLAVNDPYRKYIPSDADLLKKN